MLDNISWGGIPKIGKYIYFFKKKQAEKTALELQNKLQGLKSEIGNITETLFAKKVKLEAIKTALNANKDALEEQQNALKEAEEEYLILEQDLKKETLNLKNLLSLYQTADLLQPLLH
jgi:predicted  nucleic acid-binding Zn-ribbon protein